MIETRFKDTEVGRIPEDWKVKTIGDIFEFKNGLNASKDCFGFGSPIINYTDVYRQKPLGRSNIKGKVFLSKSDVKRFQVQKNDVFFTRTSETPEEVGYSSVLLEDVEDCVFSGFVLRARPKLQVLAPAYCVYSFSTKQVRNAIINGCTYTTRALTNGRVLSSIPIPIPPLAEQTRIATALSNIDALISELGRLIEKKRAIKQGAMQQLLTGKKRLKRVVVSNRFKHTEMGELPDDWEVCTIDDIAVITTGSQNTQDYVENGIYPFYVRSQQVERINKWIFDTEGVVTAGDGVGTGKVFHYVKGKFGLHQRCYLIHKFSSQMNARFFYWIFSSYFYERVHSMTAKSSVDSVRREMIADMHVPLPPLDEQIQIASVLTSMDNEISALEAKKAKYEQIKQGMMQQLLTGKIRLVETTVKTNATSANVHFRRSVLAAEIAERLYEEPTFGHVKMEKMLFLTERLCHIDIGSHYHRDAAGPYDNRALRSIDSQLKKQKWFEVRRTEKGNRYVPMQNCGKHKKYFDKYFSAVLPTFEKIIDTFKTQNTERCEIVATLYSAWEDLLHSNKSFTDADIVNEVLNNWHESKKRISQDRWLSAIQWMRENGFAPDYKNN